jgi:CSLREA domain-containing protein
MTARRLIQPAIIIAIAAALELVAGAPAPAGAAVTYTVNSTNDADDGTCDATHCSLREAINAANANPGKDTIAFSSSLGNLIVIKPLSQLPIITDPLVLDGAMSSSSRRVTLDGSLAPPGTSGVVIASAANDVLNLIIHSFPSHGIVVQGGGETNNYIAGNVIGTDRNQVTPLGNAGHGLFIDGSAYNWLVGNVVVANALDGYRVQGGGSYSNIIGYGGNIGAAFRPLGNERHGVSFGDGAHHNLVNEWDHGDTTILEIAYNGGDGVHVEDTADFNSVGKVSIHSNGGMGVNLGLPGTDPNDPGDADTGANGLINHPIITAVTYAPHPTSVTAEIHSTPNTSFFVIFYTSKGCDASGYGEGAGSGFANSVTTDGVGFATLTKPINQAFYSPDYQGYAVTAILTDTETSPPRPTGVPAGRSSEFSNCFTPPGPDADGDAFNDTIDNCPAVANPEQVNTHRDLIDTSPPRASGNDLTRVISDAIGDKCDPDDDNDGLADTDEASGALCGGTITETLYADSDFDRYTDTAECAIGTDPLDKTNKPTPTQCASQISVLTSDDTDGDKIRDHIEFCHHASDRLLDDSDADGTSDGCEIVSLNTDLIVNSGDQGLLGSLLGAGGSNGLPYFSNTDINRDGLINSGDQGLMASFIIPAGQCP